MTPKHPLAAASLALALVSLPLTGKAQVAFDVTSTDSLEAVSANIRF